MAQKFLAPHYSLLVIGGSAGSIRVIIDILPDLKVSEDLAIILVLHRKSAPDNNLLSDLLSARTSLQVKEAEEKQLICPGNIYIAPPDYHLLIENDHTISLDASEKVNFSRPSIDVTFESAALAYGKGLVCLLLSGANSDGAIGMKMARQLGALTAIQAPSSAEVAVMPQSARNILHVDNILMPTDIASFINDLT